MDIIPPIPAVAAPPSLPLQPIYNNSRPPTCPVVGAVPNNPPPLVPMLPRPAAIPDNPPADIPDNMLLQVGALLLHRNNLMRQTLQQI